MLSYPVAAAVAEVGVAIAIAGVEMEAVEAAPESGTYC